MNTRETGTEKRTRYSYHTFNYIGRQSYTVRGYLPPRPGRGRGPAKRYVPRVETRLIGRYDRPKDRPEISEKTVGDARLWLADGFLAAGGVNRLTNLLLHCLLCMIRYKPLGLDFGFIITYMIHYSDYTTSFLLTF